MTEQLHDYSAPQIAALLRDRAKRAWIALRLSNDPASEILRVPSGACVSLTAPTGEGKSTLALQVAAVHAETAGPAVYLSLELDADEIGARIVGQRCGVSWEDALAGNVDPALAEAALQLPRLHVLARNAANLTQLKARVIALRSLHPGQPILVAVDYVQIMPTDGNGLDGDPRIRVAAVVEQIRSETKELDVATIIISQCSREMSEQLHTGNRTGDRTIAAGAESAQLERAAHATLAIGALERGKEDAEGFAPVKVSIGKNRMGRGNVVIPMRFNGSTGVFRVVGSALPAAEVTAASKAITDGDRVVHHVRTDDRGYRSRTELAKACGGNKQRTLVAIDAELKAGRLEYRGTGKAKLIYATAVSPCVGAPASAG